MVRRPLRRRRRNSGKAIVPPTVRFGIARPIMGNILDLKRHLDITGGESVPSVHNRHLVDQLQDVTENRMLKETWINPAISSKRPQLNLLQSSRRVRRNMDGHQTTLEQLAKVRNARANDHGSKHPPPHIREPALKGSRSKPDGFVLPEDFAVRAHSPATPEGIQGRLRVEAWTSALAGPRVQHAGSLASWRYVHGA
jgi:hypothetical protein